MVKTVALVSALVLSACASSPGEPSTDQPRTEWSEWSEFTHGVRCRVSAPSAATQGDLLSIAVQLDVSVSSLPEGRHLLDPDLRHRCFVLELLPLDGRKVEVRPYDPYGGMFPDCYLFSDGGGDATNDLLAGDSRAFSIDFPLATEWNRIEPGVYRFQLSLGFDPPDARHWKAELTSPQGELRIAAAPPREEVLLLPKTLRVEGGRVTYHAEDAEAVHVKTRNGCWIGARIDAEGGSGMIMSQGAVPQPDDVNPIDAVNDPSQHLASSYTITVFETAEADDHMCMPSEGTGGYRQLWRRRLEPVR